VIGMLKHADIMMKWTSLLMRKVENSGIQTGKRRLNYGVRRRRAEVLEEAGI